MTHLKQKEDYPAWLTAPEAAEILRIHVTTVYELVRQGKLPVIKIGRSIRINRDKLLEHPDNKERGL